MENTTSQTNLESAIAQAEERGYLRGLNEAAAKRMDAPAAFETVPPPGAEIPATAPEPEFLSSPRRSIWDNP